MSFIDRSKRSRAWPALVAAALAILAGANTLFSDFTYDDIPIIKDNPVITGNAPATDIWTRDYWAHVHGWHANRDLLYRPITLSTYRLNYFFGGAGPFGYHLVNVLLHAGVAAMVVLVAACIGWATPVPAIAGALFAIMPIHVEAVAGIVGRAELLAALFTLLAICIALRHERAPHSSRVGNRHAGRALTGAVLVALFVLAALLSKESGIAALIIVPLLAATRVCKPHGDYPRRPSSRAYSALRIPHSALAWAPCLVAAAIYLPLRYHALDGRLVMTTVPSGITNMLVDASLAQRFWGAWQLLGLYVAKTFWPAKLCMDYSYKAMNLADSPWSVYVLLGLVAFTALMAGAVFGWRQGQRGLAVVCVAVVIAYLPVSNTLFLMKTLFAERVWYMPSAFGAIVVAAAGVQAVNRLKSWSRAAPKAAIAGLGLVIMAGMARSWVRNADWQHNAALFESAYRIHPTSAPVLYTYGRHLVLKGDPRGIKLLEQCVQIAPGLTDAQVELGRAYLRKGAHAAALPHLQAATMQQPGYPDLQEMLRFASARVSGERRTELERLSLDVQNAPDDLSSLIRLCEALTQSGAVGEAVQEFAAAAERFGERPEFHSGHAVALMTTGQSNEAIAAYRRSLELQLDQPAVLAELAMALLDRNGPSDAEEAADLLDRAERVAPDNTQVLIARAELFALRGREDEAAAIFRRLIGSLPPGEFRDSLQARLELLAKQ